jgi:hypothetical protein
VAREIGGYLIGHMHQPVNRVHSAGTVSIRRARSLNAS